MSLNFTCTALRQGSNRVRTSLKKSKRRSDLSKKARKKENRVNTVKLQYSKRGKSLIQSKLLRAMQVLPSWTLLRLIRYRRPCRKVLMQVCTTSRPTRRTRPTAKRLNRARRSRQLKAKRARKREKEKLSTFPTASRTSRERNVSKTRAWIINLLILSNNSRDSLMSVPKWASNLSLQIGVQWMSGTRTTSTRIWMSSITLATGSVSGRSPLSISEMRTLWGWAQPNWLRWTKEVA